MCGSRSPVPGDKPVLKQALKQKRHSTHCPAHHLRFFVGRFSPGRFFPVRLRLAAFFFALRLILTSASIRSSTASCFFALRRIHTRASRRSSTGSRFFAMHHPRRKSNLRQ